MVTLHEVITFLVSMQISISSLQTHNVNRCGRSRHLARKIGRAVQQECRRPISYAVFCLKKKKKKRKLHSTTKKKKNKNTISSHFTSTQSYSRHNRECQTEAD